MCATALLSHISTTKFKHQRWQRGVWIPSVLSDHLDGVEEKNPGKYNKELLIGPQHNVKAESMALQSLKKDSTKRPHHTTATDSKLIYKISPSVNRYSFINASLCFLNLHQILAFQMVCEKVTCCRTISSIFPELVSAYFLTFDYVFGIAPERWPEVFIQLSLIASIFFALRVDSSGFF